MDKMMKKICKFPNGTNLRVEWQYGELVLDGTIDKIYETDNGLDEEDGFKEYYGCAFKINNIINNDTDKNFTENSLIETSVENEPTLIMSNEGIIIWKK